MAQNIHSCFQREGCRQNKKSLEQRQIEPQLCKHQMLKLHVWYLVLHLLSSFAACSIHLFFFRVFHTLDAVLSGGSLMILAPPTFRGLYSKTSSTFTFQCSCLCWLQFSVSDPVQPQRLTERKKKNPRLHQSSNIHASKTNTMWLTLYDPITSKLSIGRDKKGRTVACFLCG